MSDDASSPGWDAIDRALKPLYGDQEPLHWAPSLLYSLGGSDPLDGISAYQHAGPIPHWHFITYGFSELYLKESTDSECSGYGFELTLRLRCAHFDSPPPHWVLSLLQNLARYIFSSGNAFDSGHYMPLNGPILVGSDTQLWAIALMPDPELPGIETPHGHVDFLQVIGITLDELAAMKAWDTRRFLEAIRPNLPLWITDLERSSLTTDAAITALVEAGVQSDGSSTAFLFVSVASWQIESIAPSADRLLLTLGATGVRDFKVVLPGRIPHNRPLKVASKNATVAFAPSDQCSWEVNESDGITIHLTSLAAREIAKVVAAKEGTYLLSLFPGLSVRVVKSEIKDPDGKVVEIIG